MAIGRLIRIAIIPTLAFAWVVLQYVQLDGERVVTWQIGARSPFIAAPLPADRTTVVANNLRLTDDPIYFHVTPPPGRWRTVEVKADIDPGQQPVIELGTVVDARLNSLDLRPAYHATLENLGDDWLQNVVDGQLIATRRGSNPARTTTRVYRASSEPLLPQPWSLGPLRSLPAHLAGGHELWFYGQAGQTFTWSVEVVDHDLIEGSDEVALILYDDQGLELTRTSLSDTNSTDPRPLTLTADLPAVGSYRLALSSTSDISWRNIKTNASKLVTKNHLRFAEPSSVPVWTTAAIVGVEEILGKRAIGLGEGEHQIQSLAPGSAAIGDGWFALSKSELWSPTMTPLTSATDLEKVDRLIATMPSFEQSFDFSALQREQNGSFRLVISLPNVSSLSSSDQPVLRQLSISFKR